MTGVPAMPMPVDAVDVLAVEYVHPVQLIPEREKPCAGERRLIAALMYEAIREALDIAPKPKDYRGDVVRDARRWIASQSMMPFSFEWMCEPLELNAQWARMHLPEVLLRLKLIRGAY